ncbi:MAG TPA: ThuA domain-containing protein [Solirubrobacteraceae bacterium]|nr:ThuA domain-containing protein [Solirubrobacteraceae bacterium]
MKRACLAVGLALAALLCAGVQAEAASNRVQYKVLVFTKATAGTHASTAAGASAIKALGKQYRFVVQVTDKTDRFTDADLESYRVIVFLNTSGDVLSDDEQGAFERWFQAGGGFVGIHSAIETEPEWTFLDDILGARATGEAELDEATIKVADRVHDASRTLPERWVRSDRFYNFDTNVRGDFHVLATVDETSYTGGTMGFDHPYAWCKDTQGGRAFYTAGGDTAASFSEADFREHLVGAFDWAAGIADPVYSDCGATVLSNYQQVKISAPPNLNEPIGFDQFPDGRLIQTTRDGRVRLHDPATGDVDVIANIPVYTVNEDGLYGPAVDADFATNKWVYLFYSPLAMEGNSQSGVPYPASTPPGAAPVTAPDPSVWDQWNGYFQLSRFKFVEGQGQEPPRLDTASEQKIMKVEMNRGACCHVAGDIDFDDEGNLWLVTGDDTPATALGANNYPPFNDMKTNESQVVRVQGATGGTFTLTFDGQTTAPIAFNADAATIRLALEALAAIEPGDVAVTGNGNVSTNNQTISFRGAFAQQNLTQTTGDGALLTGGAPLLTTTTSQEGGWFAAPFNDARRGALNTNDLRGKALRIKVNADGSYSIPPGNMFPESEDTANQTRPEIYAMGFRNPFRIQVDSDGVAYVTDYSPDANAPGPFRAAAGTGRIEIVRKPSNYGWPVCYSPTLPMYKWDFNTQTTLGVQHECGNPAQGPANESRWNTGRAVTPPITQPDVWYSFRDDLWGTPCVDGYNRTPAAACPRLFPELGQGGVGPHGATKYEYDPDNPSETKFPPYYDDAVFFAEWTRDYLREIRLDSDGNVLKINNVLNCGAALTPTPVFPFECDNPMDQQFGADGNYYMLTYGDGFFTANPDAGLYRFEYVAGPQRPAAVLGATPTSGTAPLAVQFTSEGSRDPDEGDSIRFEWDFESDGTVDSIDPAPTHTYTANGTYTARLTVTDAGGRSDSKTIRITVGNTAPAVTITTPVDGDFFEWGQTIPFTVTVNDPEDGTIDCSAVEVSLVLVHDQHGHGESTVTGCSGTLPTGADLAFHGGYLGAGVSATYTDEGGGGQSPLSTTVQHVVQTRRQQVEFTQEARGITFPAVNVAEPDPGGGQIAASLDPGDYLSLNNRYHFGNMNQEISFRFAQATAGAVARGIVDVRTDSPTGDVVASCTLLSTGGANTYTTQTCPFTTPVTGSRRLVLTFRQATGGPGTNFGNLNWVQFSGTGVGF